MSKVKLISVRAGERIPTSQKVRRDRRKAQVHLAPKGVWPYMPLLLASARLLGAFMLTTLLLPLDLRMLSCKQNQHLEATIDSWAFSESLKATLGHQVVRLDIVVS